VSKVTISFEVELDEAGLLMALHDLLNEGDSELAVTTVDNYFWLIDRVLEPLDEIASQRRAYGEKLSWWVLELIKLTERASKKSSEATNGET
jgi:hypothetical protein